MKTVLRSLATAHPDRYVKGDEAYAYFKNYWPLTPSQDQLYQKVLLEGPNQGRYIAIHHDTFPQLPDQDTLIEQFRVAAGQLNRKAAQKALHRAGLVPADIQAVVVNTCTGYLCPGLSSYLLEDLDFPRSTRGFDLMGMGCGAALPNLETACSLAARYEGPVLSVAVEICSATLFDSPDPGCIISNCIFADGAAAAVVSPETPSKGARAAILDFRSGIFPRHRDSLKFVSDGGKLRNVLSVRVPVIGAKTVSDVTAQLLAQNKLRPEDIHHWAIHPGGTAVLEQVQKQLRLTDGHVRPSLDIFKSYGNMSSPSVLFVLNSILDKTTTRPGDLCCVLSFGAGFSAHAALLQITQENR